MKIGKIYRANPEFQTAPTFSSAGKMEDYSYRIWEQPEFNANIIGVFDGETTDCISFLLLEHIPHSDPENSWCWLKILTEKGMVGYITTKIDIRWLEAFE